MRRLAVLMIVLLSCGACGKSSSKSDAKPKSSATKATTSTVATTTTAAPTADELAYIRAATDGVDTSGFDPALATPAFARCLAAALVRTATVARLKAAHVTLSQLRSKGEHLPPALAASMDNAARVALGRAIQACDFARVAGPALTDGIGEGSTGVKPTAAEQNCVVARLAAPPQALLIADIALLTALSNADATALARMMLGCLNFAPLFGQRAGLSALSPTEQACINRQARTSPTMEHIVAGSILGKPDTSEETKRIVGSEMLSCLSAAHIREIGGK